MNLKEGLGIVEWHSFGNSTQHLDQGTQDVSFVSEVGREIWCVGEELVDCWESNEDLRWQLLINIAQAVGVRVDLLQPAEIDDVPSGELVWLFDGQHGLPLLQTMLDQTDQKRIAWQWLCRQNYR